MCAILETRHASSPFKFPRGKKEEREREREREGNSLETIFQEAVFLKSTLVLQEWGDSVHRYVVDNEMNVIWNDKHLWAP